ncbi:MAG TPA: FAD:protein FMN transferase [Kiritimatiellia bacterium]|nr:FAD:protein FMN transferase [Kiritimatiellia bacterium]
MKGFPQRPIISPLLLALLLAACSRPEPEVLVIELPRIAAQLHVAPSVQDTAGPALIAARDQLLHTLNALDETRPDSEIARINRTAGSVRLPISRNTFRLLDLGHYYSRLTDGLYDYTMGPVANLWGFKQPAPPANPPSEVVLFERLEATGMRHIQIFTDGAIAMTSPQVRIELGAIREAYAVDLAIVELRRQGYSRLFLHAGRAARQLDTPDPAHPWIHPIVTTDGLHLGDLRIPEAHPALAWQSLHDETLLLAGQTISGLINPRTGRPADQGAFALAASTTSTRAMILAQVALIAGPDRTSSLFPLFDGVELLYLPLDPREPLRITPALRPYFKPSASLNRPIQTWEPHREPTPSPEPDPSI